MSDKQLMLEMLREQISCGEPELAVLIDKGFDALYCTQALVCDQSQLYNNMRLEILTIAQDYARNRVDEATRRAQSDGRFKQDSKNERSTRTTHASQNTSCAWSNSTAFRDWFRDREAHDRAFSNAFDTMSSYFFNIGTDRSRNGASGIASSSTSSASGSSSGASSIGDGFSRSLVESDGGTGPFREAPEMSEISLSAMFTYSEFTIPVLNVPVYIPTGLSDAAYKGFTSEPPACPSPPSITVPLVYTPPPSHGASTSTNVSASLPFIGNLGQVAGGGGYRVTSTAYQTRRDVWGETMRKASGSSASSSESETFGSGFDCSFVRRVVDRNGESHRKQNGELHAGSTSVDVGHGETHTGSEQAGHSEGQSGSKSVGTGHSHSETTGIGSMRSTAISDKRHWSQISEALARMWRDTLDEIKNEIRVAGASFGVGVGRITRPDTAPKCTPFSPSASACRMRPCTRQRGCTCGTCSTYGTYGTYGTYDTYAYAC